MGLSPMPTAELRDRRRLRRIPRSIVAAIAGAGTIAAWWPAAAQLTGVNISGAELGYAVDHPGRIFFDYIYPSDAELDYFRGKGANVIRVPVRWERLQRSVGGGIDPDELQRIRLLVDHAATRGMSIIVDIHNFGVFRGQKIGSAAVPTAALAGLWGPLAQAFAANPRVIFGLMNEPAGVSGPVLRQAVDAALGAIRRAKAENLVLVPGVGWSGAHDFVRLSAGVLDRMHDPADNFAYEVHQYFDFDHSGTHPDCAGPEAAAGMLKGVAHWLRRRSARGFLGEFGTGRSENCLASLRTVLADLLANRDVWLGWTYWAGGPWWGDYPLTVEPEDGQDRPQMTVLSRFFAKTATLGRH